MGVLYASVEDVRNAVDVAPSVLTDARIFRVLEAASRGIDTLCHRKFYPQAATRYFDYPNHYGGNTTDLELNQHEVLSVSALSAGGTTITSGQYYLEPNGDGPPYDRISINLGSSGAWGTGPTWQRDITVTGVFGYCNGTETAGTVVEALDTSETGVDISNSTLVGVGDTVLVDSEYMLVTGRTWLTTGQTLQVALTASSADTTVVVTDTSGIFAGETLLIGSERVSVLDVASGTNLSVKRAVHGTTLAAHSGSTVYAPRTLTVTRGALGTTAATHTISTALYRHVVPSQVRALAVAEALNMLKQEESAYLRAVGGGDNAREAVGAGLEGLRAQVRYELGRQARRRAV